MKMKTTLASSLLGLSCLAMASVAMAQQHITGPSSSLTPYQRVYSSAPANAKLVSILTVGDAVGGYKMAGLADGMGAFDNGDSTFTVVMNHEMGNTAGAVRAHGSKGAFISKWVIKKDPNDLQVISGQDLMQKLFLWDKAAQTYVMYYITTPFATGLSRFCSGDMAAATAFYNSATGKGTTARIFMNGEENGLDGRPFAHVVTGPEAGNSYHLPHLGAAAWENYVACPRESDTTIAIGTDDGTDGQVYVYVGVKKSTGNVIERAGLTDGKLYGIKIPGLVAESNGVVVVDSNFTLADLGPVRDTSGSIINSKSNNLGVMKFQRPEDGAWDPAHPNDFYFLTTNAVGSPSRMYRLRFNDMGNPAAGGKITAVLTGTEGQIMMDNMGIDHFGNALIQEDQGGDNSLASTWQYNFSSQSFTRLLIHDSTKFRTGAANYITNNEEASGIIDVQDILGPGWFIGSDQVHVSAPGELVEGGQMFAYFNPDTYNANPEIDLVGNNNSIPNGSMNPSAGNNTDFGNVIKGKTVTKTFDIKNAGPASLTVTGINFTGADASDYSLTVATFPMTIAANGTQTITVQFAPPLTALGFREAEMNILSNDFDENKYTVGVQGVALDNLGVSAMTNGAMMKLFPNPTRDEVTVSVTLKNADEIGVAIFDINGRKMIEMAPRQYPAGEQKIMMNTSVLPSGNYFVQVTAGNAITRTKLVVAH